MRKLALAGLAVLIVIAAVGPWVTGHLVEQEWRAAITQFNQQQDLVKLETVTYERGYMGGHTRTRVTFSGQDAPDKPVLLETRFSHGVTDARGETHWLMEEWPEIAEAFTDEQPVLVTKTGLWGGVYGKFTVPAAQWTDTQEGRIQLQPLRVDYRFGRDGDTIELEMTWQGLQVTAESGEMAIEGLRLVEDMERVDDQVWAGDMLFSIDRVHGSASDGSPFVMEAIAVEGHSAKTDEERMKSSVDVTIASLSANDRAFKNIAIEAAASQLYVPAMSEMLKRMQAYEDLAAIEDPHERAVQELKAFGHVMESVQQLVGHGVEITIPKLNMDTPEGTLRGRIGVKHPAMPEKDIAEMGSILARAQGAISLAIPKAFVEQTDPRLRQSVRDLIQRGWMTVQGENLVLEAELKDMALHVGGEMIPLPPLI